MIHYRLSMKHYSKWGQFKTFCHLIKRFYIDVVHKKWYTFNNWYKIVQTCIEFDDNTIHYKDNRKNG